jgi:pimeloyl-ACP methyl ester carboxylesterase
MRPDFAAIRPFTPGEGLPGEAVQWESAAGRLSMRVSGAGAPLLLIHSINAAPSCAEVAPLHRHYEQSRCVFSLELPGFGASERSDRAYTPRLMTDAIHAAVQEIQRRCGPAPIDVLALSLSCEFLARAASEQPDRYRSVALVSPTGFNGRGTRRGPPGSTMSIPWLLRLLRGSALWPMLFRALTRPGVIRFFLRKTFGSPQISQWLHEQAVQTAGVAGAAHAPLYFLTGSLFSRDIHTLYDALQCPVWMCHGVRGDFTDYRQKSRLQGAANWHFSVMPTGALPQFEVPESFFGEYDRFLLSTL